jgi:hypothetical protein
VFKTQVGFGNTAAHVVYMVRRRISYTHRWALEILLLKILRSVSDSPFSSLQGLYLYMWGLYIGVRGRVRAVLRELLGLYLYMWAIVSLERPTIEVKETCYPIKRDLLYVGSSIVEYE